MFVQQKSKVLPSMKEYLEYELPYALFVELEEGFYIEYGIRTVVVGFKKDTITVYEYEGELQIQATDYQWNTATGVDNAIYRCKQALEQYRMSVN